MAKLLISYKTSLDRVGRVNGQTSDRAEIRTTETTESFGNSEKVSHCILKIVRNALVFKLQF